MNRTSIRRRITAIAVVAVGVVLLIASLLVIAIQRVQLTSNIDTTLIQRADDVAAFIATADPIPPVLAGSSEEGFAQLTDNSGRVISSTPNLEGEQAPVIEYEPGSGLLLRNVDGLEVDDDVFRVLSRPVETTSGGAVLHVGTTFDVVAESVLVLTGTLSVAIPAVLVVVGVLVWWLVGRTLRPVEAIRSEVATIGKSDLHRRVPQPPHEDEIGRLAHTMNEMLERVEEAMVRQQRFVADASHELRSPLARLRAEIEVRLLGTDSDERDELESLLEEVVGLQRMVEDLLDLARADSAHDLRRSEPVDLDDLVFREAENLKMDSGVLIDVAGVSAAQVQGDPLQLTRAIRNLCDNARRHAKAKVTITLGERSGRAILTVGDDGPGIPPEQADSVFERFGRLDGSRSRAGGGTGLGLAITREIIEAHDGTVHIDPDRRPGALFVVSLPLA
ncbi:MAG: HAMP domain-containing histidine kinase [Actinobacteria bacterium]|nr:HAMP domain-containing histidine kinase [Actinomycetota bacterium]